MKLPEKIDRLKISGNMVDDPNVEDSLNQLVEAHNKLVDAVIELVKYIPNFPHEWEAGFPDEGVL